MRCWLCAASLLLCVIWVTGKAVPAAKKQKDLETYSTPWAPYDPGVGNKESLFGEKNVYGLPGISGELPENGRQAHERVWDRRKSRTVHNAMGDEEQDSEDEEPANPRVEKPMIQFVRWSKGKAMKHYLRGYLSQSVEYEELSCLHLVESRLSDAPKVHPEETRSVAEDQLQERTTSFVLDTILGESRPVYLRGSGSGSEGVKNSVEEMFKLVDMDRRPLLVEVTVTAGIDYGMSWIIQAVNGKFRIFQASPSESYSLEDWIAPESSQMVGFGLSGLLPGFFTGQSNLNPAKNVGLVDPAKLSQPNGLGAGLPMSNAGGLGPMMDPSIGSQNPLFANGGLGGPGIGMNNMGMGMNVGFGMSGALGAAGAMGPGIGTVIGGGMGAPAMGVGVGTGMGMGMGMGMGGVPGAMGMSGNFGMAMLQNPKNDFEVAKFGFGAGQMLSDRAEIAYRNNLRQFLAGLCTKDPTNEFFYSATALFGVSQGFGHSTNCHFDYTVYQYDPAFCASQTVATYSQFDTKVDKFPVLGNSFTL